MLEELRKITKEKHNIDITRNSWYEWSTTYFECIKSEINEVKEELRVDNTIHLEDELWDILWTYLLLLEWLEKEWKITSFEAVFARAEKKYRQRIDAIKDEPTDEGKSRAWKNVKIIQKAELKEEHNKKYT